MSHSINQLNNQNSYNKIKIRYW